MTPPPDLGLGLSHVYLHHTLPTPTVARILLSYNKTPPRLFPPLDWTFLEETGLVFL